MGAALCFALSPVVIKRLPPLHPAVINFAGMLVGAIFLLGLSFATGEMHQLPQQEDTWLAQFYLILAGSIGLFVGLLLLLKRWTASAVSYQTVLTPLVVAALAAWLLGEPLTLDLVIGGAVVIVGVYVGALMG